MSIAVRRGTLQVMSGRSTTVRVSRSREPDLTYELTLMAEDIKSSRSKPVRRRFSQLIDALERSKARYALCGAVAMGAHGAERFTSDIDVLIDDDSLDRALAALSGSMMELGREPPTGRPKQVKLRSRRAKTTNAVDIDLMVPVNTVEAWALSTAVRARAFDRKVDVASPEAVVLMKLSAYLSDPESQRGLLHRSDAMWLLQLGQIDLAELRRFLRGHAELAAELERVLAAPPPRGRLG